MKKESKGTVTLKVSPTGIYSLVKTSERLPSLVERIEKKLAKYNFYGDYRLSIGDDLVVQTLEERASGWEEYYAYKVDGDIPSFPRVNGGKIFWPDSDKAEDIHEWLVQNPNPCNVRDESYLTVRYGTVSSFGGGGCVETPFGTLCQYGHASTGAADFLRSEGKITSTLNGDGFKPKRLHLFELPNGMELSLRRLEAIYQAAESVLSGDKGAFSQLRAAVEAAKEAGI